MRLAAAFLAVLLAQAAAAQDVPADTAAVAPAPERLADLRGSLGQISAELQALRSELVASGAEGFRAAGGDSAIERMNAMEAEIARLTGRIEALENRIAQVVRDGTNRIGDIEFRLCEMDPACDLGALSTAQMDAGGTAAEGIDLSPPVASATALPPATTEAERAGWEAAQAALAAGDHVRAAGLFGTLADAHAGSALAAEALFFRGAALDGAGDAEAAAQAWLQSFSAAPTGSRAPEALLGIARVLADGGKAADACLFLDDLTARFAGSPAAAEAESRMIALGCDAAAAPAAEPALDPEAAADAAEHGG